MRARTVVILFTAGVVLVLLLLLAPVAEAQLKIPPLTLPTTGVLRDATSPALGILGGAVGDLTQARALRIRELLRAQRQALDLDPSGNLIVRGEVLAFNASAGGLEREVTRGAGSVHASAAVLGQ